MPDLSEEKCPTPESTNTRNSRYSIDTPKTGTAKLALAAVLKDFFFRHCPAGDDYHRAKMWAHWIIYHQCDRQQPHDLIPTVGLSDNSQLVPHLVHDLSVPVEQAEKFYSELVSRTESAASHFLPGKEDLSIGDGNFDCPDGGGTSPDDHPELFSRYCHKDRPELITSEFSRDIATMLRNYRLLDGAGFQWQVPPRVMDVVSNWITTELFASPMNVRLQRYYSMFRADEKFGSLGNLFSQELLPPGAYEANPPFVEKVFERTWDLLFRSMRSAVDAAADFFVLMMVPNWDQCLVYLKMRRSSFFQEELVLPKYQHFYYDKSREIYVKATFDTCLLIFATPGSRFYRSWQDSKETVVAGFCEVPLLCS
ncbi:MAG: PCIF1 family methyltransferase [Sulfobacillus sp.]